MNYTTYTLEALRAELSTLRSELSQAIGTGTSELALSLAVSVNDVARELIRRRFT